MPIRLFVHCLTPHKKFAFEVLKEKGEDSSIELTLSTRKDFELVTTAFEELDCEVKPNPELLKLVVSARVAEAAYALVG